ncbi:hypothetical protein J2P12_01225 [Candidatus Bathyarchaeota archaeon]|nr:hypothetical protein [Candidatus Bathyarchaeota archaeon]
MTDLVAAIPDAFIVVGAALFAVKCFSFSRSLKGYIGRNFRIVGIAAVLFMLAELGHFAADAGIYAMGELAHDIVEAAFTIILAIGVLRFFPKWMPKS